ncbi:MAG: DUF3987 domain-containing protein [Candidatus Thiodiazotropha sp. 6PLUC6]
MKTTLIANGEPSDAPGIARTIDIEHNKAKWFHDLEADPLQDRSPPKAVPEMFPGVLADVVDLCCAHSEAVAVAVATYTLAWFSALVGPMRFYQLGDERRLLNDYFLLVGPSGQGKGASEHGPRRLFHRTEQILQAHHGQAWQRGEANGIPDYAWLDIHDGGLSSGEGLAAAKADRLKMGKDEPPVEVADKRFLLLESEFGNVLNQAQRQGNTLSHVLRSAYDGKTIRPLTKRDRVCVSDPFFVLVGNITPGELTGHDQGAVMTVNGMLNRTLMLWVRTERRVPIPRAIPNDRLEALAQQLAQAILLARGGHWDTHYRKQPELATAIELDDEARALWVAAYPFLVNPPDCELVRVLCRRHRLHVLILASLMALLNGQPQVSREHLSAALGWSDYSRRSVVFAYRYFNQQQLSDRYRQLGFMVVQAIGELGPTCSAGDVYRWFHNRIRQDELHHALDWCLNFTPPLVKQERKPTGRRGRPSFQLMLTDEGRRMLSTGG